MTTTTTTLPDIAYHEQAKLHGALDWAGMSEVPMPFRWEDSVLGTVHCEGHAQSCVNVSRPQAKGIHMSRLYVSLVTDAARHSFTPKTLGEHLRTLQQSHADLSHRAQLILSGKLYTQQKALVSEHTGWKAYPFRIFGTLHNDATSIEIECTIPYASTCPCSASLARQLVANAMQEDFKNQSQIDKDTMTAWLLSEKGSYATPHSQRSYATLRLKLASSCMSFPIKTTIDLAELALQTPVQAAVKREDEQAFARLNGQHLMFCEDAARCLQTALDAEPLCLDYIIRVEHQESLHDHHAIAVTTKGVVGGYAAD